MGNDVSIGFEYWISLLLHKGQKKHSLAIQVLILEQFDFFLFPSTKGYSSMTSSSAFAHKKQRILDALSQPAESYSDASPKGSIDEPIRDLINQINAYENLVTTSSCSGRISVFQEGSGSGGKGDKRGQEIGEKGKWLFVSHEALAIPSSLSNGPAKNHSWHEQFDLSPIMESGESMHEAGNSPPSGMRFTHFKFEPMILHILCSSSVAADKVLKCAQQAGFRESGASNVPGDADTPVNIAIRTAGLGFDCIVGCVADGVPGADGVDSEAQGRAACTSLVSEDYLSMLVHNGNEKFRVNLERMERLRSLLLDAFGAKREDDWEDATIRSERKRAEGLRRREELNAVGPKEADSNDSGVHDNMPCLSILEE